MRSIPLTDSAVAASTPLHVRPPSCRISQANPFVENGFHYLDKAMAWGAKYGIGVLLDLHAAPGSQVRRRLQTLRRPATQALSLSRRSCFDLALSPMLHSVSHWAVGTACRGVLRVSPSAIIVLVTTPAPSGS